MGQVALTGGFYRAKSIIAGAQRCCNLYPEANQKGSPVPFTYYERPGNKVTIEGLGSPSRATYRCTDDQLFEVIGNGVFYTSPAFSRTLLGTIAAGDNPVSMADNGSILVIVDGTSTGYTVNMGTHVMSTIVDAAFYGAIRVEYMDTYFVFDRPASRQFYLSPPLWDGATPFDPLDVASKVGGADNLQVAAVNAGNIQLIGILTTEIWYNSQGADFAFSRVPSVFIEHGTPAPYSVAQNDVGTYFLSQDDDGGCIFLKIAGYEAVRFSTHAIEAEISKYADISDCIGMTYQQEGHTFVRFTFPTADKTWVFDEATQMWHEQTWTDEDGEEHRHRANNTAYAYGKNLLGDWETGALYESSQTTYVDEGAVDAPIVRRRGFPHLLNDGKRLAYSKFIANMAVGTAGGLLIGEEPLVSLRWSNTRGASWEDPVTTGMGSTGEYDRWVTFWQLGMGQDRVFELFWSAPYSTALNGAFIEAEKAET